MPPSQSRSYGRSSLGKACEENHVYCCGSGLVFMERPDRPHTAPTVSRCSLQAPRRQGTECTIRQKKRPNQHQRMANGVLFDGRLRYMCAQTQSRLLRSSLKLRAAGKAFPWGHHPSRSAMIPFTSFRVTRRIGECRLGKRFPFFQSASSAKFIKGTRRKGGEAVGKWG